MTCFSIAFTLIATTLPFTRLDAAKGTPTEFTVHPMGNRDNPLTGVFGTRSRATP